jgi:hypothetical protein
VAITLPASMSLKQRGDKQNKGASAEKKDYSFQRYVSAYVKYSDILSADYLPSDLNYLESWPIFDKRRIVKKCKGYRHFIYGGLIFSFADGRVSQIFPGAAAE